jgi:hypothetical protein
VGQSQPGDLERTFPEEKGEIIPSFKFIGLTVVQA